MKICAIICEFNPFHNGHQYIISRAKEQKGCQAVVCVMSGSFTQRGDMCVTDKFLRAKHAILGGADAVIELPAPFAVAPAEVFAKGAVKVLSALNAQTTLVFGSETPDRERLNNAVKILSEENGKFKERLNALLGGGESYIRSYAAAFAACGGDEALLSSPNNILAVEYLKAIARYAPQIEYAPVKRVGGGFSETQLSGTYSSANSIRANASDPAVKEAMPDYSYADLRASGDNARRFERLATDWLYLCDKENLKRVYGCTEGLENRLKNLAFGHNYAEICELAASKRYSRTRIKRILAANLLGLYADDTEKFLNAPPPVKVLAVKKDRADELLPLLTVNTPSPEAERCQELNSRAYSLWRYLNTPLAFENENEKLNLV